MPDLVPGLHPVPAVAEDGQVVGKRDPRPAPVMRRVVHGVQLDGMWLVPAPISQNGGEMSVKTVEKRIVETQESSRFPAWNELANHFGTS